MILTYLSAAPIFNIFLCLGLGLFTFSRNPRHPANIGLFLGLTGICIIEAGTALILLSGASAQKALFGARVSLIGQALLPPSWLLFSTVFASKDYKQLLRSRLPLLAAFFAVSLFFVFQTASPQFISFSKANAGIIEADEFFMGIPVFNVGSIGFYFYLYFFAGLLINLVNVENTLRSSRGQARWQIKYIIFGVGAIFAFFTYVSIQVFLFSKYNGQLAPAASFVILISASMMALFIVRNQLLDVDVFVSRYVIYRSATVLGVGLYMLIVGVFIQGIKYFNIPYSYFFISLFFFLALLLLVVILFVSQLRRKAQLFINRHFYKHKYEFRDKWMETIDRISTKASKTTSA